MAAKIFIQSRRCAISVLMCLFALCACTVGPDYQRPSVDIPAKFKEAPKHWKIAEPQDTKDRGQWWKTFKDPKLNALEDKLNISNQTILVAAAQYMQAKDLVDEARASYFPTVTGSAALTRQRVVTPGANSSPTTSQVYTNHTLLLNALWEPDIWGSVHRTVEASVANAEASDALLESTRLSSQASLAQIYFELCAVDRDQELLNNTVKDYKESLQLTRNRYASGVAGRADVVQAQSLLEAAKAQAINNGIVRAQFEHAMAVLIGEPPAVFTFAYAPLKAVPPTIPLQIPSVWLERRPDVAQSERLMAQANAQIGIAIAAYFPTLSLTATGSVTNFGYANWLSVPGLNWALGPSLAQTFLDGGLRAATVAAARANYDATVATYRETVLTAFQDVEDNLAALRILSDEMVEQNKAAASARLALKLVINEYKAGTAAYSDVITAQIAAYTAEKNAADINGLRMTSAVGLIKALGGGFRASDISA